MSIMYMVRVVQIFVAFVLISTNEMFFTCKNSSFEVSGAKTLACH